MIDKFKTIVLLTVVGFFSFLSSANASIIVDTGIPAGFYFGQISGVSTGIANNFTLNQAYFLTDAQSFLMSNGRSLTLSIYDDGGDVPDISDEIYSGIINTQEGSQDDWYGVSNMNLYLDPGTYWIALEVRLENGDDYDGFFKTNPPYPLESSATSFVVGYGLYNYSPDGIKLGFRIQGNPVPIPSAFWLLSSGFACLIGLKRQLLRR